MFLKPEKLQNHGNEGKGKEKKKERGGRKRKGGEEKKAMVAILVFITATLEIDFGRKRLLDAKVHFQNPARYRSLSLSRNKKINWKPSSGRSQENEML